MRISRVRVPLLDHRLVEFVAQLPESVKRGCMPKALLVEALGDLLPHEVVRQPSARSCSLGSAGCAVRCARRSRPGWRI